MQSIQMIYFAYKFYLDSVVFMRRITIFCYIIKGEGRAVSVVKLFVRYYYKCIIRIFSMASPSMWQLLIPSYTDLRHHDVSLMEMKHRDVEELCEM